MSLVPRPAPSLFDPNAQAIIDMSPPADPVAPGALDVMGAAFRQENLVGSVLARHRADGTPDPAYNPWGDIKGTPYEAQWDRFTRSTNAGETAALKAQIDMEENDRNTIAAAGGWGMLATLGAGLFSPENLLPAGEIYRGIKGGQAVLRSALSGASYGAMSAALGESVLAGTQELRTSQDNAIGIGSAALLGGVLGGGLSAMFSRGDFTRLAAQMGDEAVHAVDSQALAANEAAMFIRPGVPSSAGAAARPVASLEENSIAGRAAQIAGGAVRNLNPVLRALHSPSAIMRDVATRLFENPVYMKKNLEGVASDPGVETLVKEYTRGAVSKAMEAANAAYGDYRKAGGQMSRGDFNQAVGKAMRRGDASADPHVAQAATAWRSAVFDPLKQEASEAKLLPADVQPETALSYFTRVYNRPKIEAREAEFKGIVRRYVDRSVRAIEARRDEAEGLPDFVSEADRADYIGEVVDNIFNTVTGRNVDGDVPRDIVAATRGPLKERTFHIPDSEIEDFLEHDVEAIGRRYARVMASDIELTKAFGRADLRDQIDAVKRQYGDLRRAIEDGIDPRTGEVLAMQLTQRQKLAAVRRLVAREKGDIRDLQALRDMVRGSYLARENGTNYARAARVAGTINFLRTMGGVTLSSLGDVGRTLMVHTLTGTMRDGLIPLMRNLKGFQMSVAEAKTAGAVAERILNTRMATWAEIIDPYSVSSPFERFMQNTANGFSHLTGMAYWNDFQKSFASVITQNRVLRGTAHFSKLDHRERAYLAYLGIDGQMAERIAKQFEAHGTTEDGDIRVANSDDWSDEWARRVYRAAINKDVDTTIVTKGVGDVPLFFNTPTGRLLGQFKSFALASHQRALMRGLQERPMGMVSGVLVSTGIGMLIYYLKSVESNRTADLSNNPGRWIAEGLDRSGIFAIAFEANNTIEKAFGIGAYGALAAAFPGADQDGKASRYIARSTAAALTGPTGDLVDGLVRAVQAIKGSGDGLSKGDITAFKRLMPGATLPGIRSLVEYLGAPAAEAATGAR